VKCDETIPECRRCISTGRKCEGYPHVAALTPAGDTPEVSQNTTLDSSPRSPSPNSAALIVTRSPSLQITGTKEERWSFYFFQHKIASQLSGFYGETFWDKQILRATHYEPCIKHAIIALGSLYERCEKTVGGALSRYVSGSSDGDFALREYNTAIRLLVVPFQHNKSAPLDVCLMACILFACFEVIIILLRM
jgi:hypothetical protein